VSFRVVQWVLDHSRAANAVDKLVLVCIAQCADHDGGNAFAAEHRLIHEACTTRRTLYRSLARLEEIGELVREPRYDNRGRAVTAYRIDTGPDVRVGATLNGADVRVGATLNSDGGCHTTRAREQTVQTGDSTPTESETTSPSLPAPSLTRAGEAEAAFREAWNGQHELCDDWPPLPPSCIPRMVATPKPGSDRSKLIRGVIAYLVQHFPPDEARPTLDQAIQRFMVDAKARENGWSVDTFCRHFERWLDATTALPL
jgi:hypothetical protein